MKTNNIISYTRENGDSTFAVSPFSAVDSLVLSQICYLQFGHWAEQFSPSEPICIGDLPVDGSIKSSSSVRTSRNNQELLVAMINSKRWANTYLHYCVEESSAEHEKQFSAVTFLMETGISYLSFRGTDSTFLGWKEDFNMSFMEAVPSQLAGVTYLNKVAELVDGPIFLGGHSKGGNVAVFSAATCEPEIRSRIKAIYNHDGPGFRNEVFSSDNYLQIKDRIHKTVPQSSVFGMLLQHHEDYTVVKSNRMGILQHDPFSWIVQDGDFVRLDKQSGSSTYMNTTINNWLETIDDNTRQLFFDTLYAIIISTDARSIADLKQNLRKNASAILNATTAIDSETKAVVRKTVALFIKEAGRNFPRPFSKKTTPTATQDPQD